MSSPREGNQGGRRFLVAGLGNPGERYCFNRHNAGFMALDRFAAELGLDFGSFGRLGRVARGRLDGGEFALLKPMTYMNRSGSAVGGLLDRLELTPGRLMVVSDDYQIPLGRIRIRPWGSAGGHNGLKSIIRTLGTEEFARIRLGIGPVPSKVAPEDFVLGNFKRHELEEFHGVLDRAVAALRLYLERGDLDLCMSRYNPPVAGTETEGSK